jgi:hypothetical protein
MESKVLLEVENTGIKYSYDSIKSIIYLNC